MSTLHTNTRTFVPLFQQPGGEANFFDKVRERQVCLENAVIQDSEAPCICGTVRVRNLDFNKSVHIRYTIDSWKSFADLQATYLANSCDGFSDKFSFTLAKVVSTGTTMTVKITPSSVYQRVQIQHIFLFLLRMTEIGLVLLFISANAGITKISVSQSYRIYTVQYIL
ncbi:Glycogen binding subunit 76A [Carabus blaptoides fortunei]